MASTGSDSRHGARLLDGDPHDERLRAEVAPPGWTNPTPSGRYNLVVVGAGTAGLVSAAIAAGLGGRVALVERALMGGDCLNVGCVPSKGLLRAARAVADARDARRFGVTGAGDAAVDFAAVMQRMRAVRADIGPHDGARRFTELGVDVYLGHGRFTGRDSLAVGDTTLRFARAVIATGGRAAAPPIPGLDSVAYLTNENLFTLTALPPRLAVVGAGPIGVEMAQAFARFGSAVTLIEAGPRVLGREDEDAAALVAAALRRDGVALELGAKLRRVAADGADKLLNLADGDHADAATRELRVDAVLVAVGRKPNLNDLGLEAAGVGSDPRVGVTVDDFLATSNPRIYAAGDVCSAYKFTHSADFLARIVVQNALFALGPFGRRRASTLTIPWCTYSDPELAHVGLSEQTAAERGVALDTYTAPLSGNDRARLDGDEAGFVKLHAARGSDRLLGATVVARHAGELISELTLALRAGVRLGTLADTIHPYPTQADAIRAAAGQFTKARLTPRAARLLKAWLAWRR